MIIGSVDKTAETQGKKLLHFRALYVILYKSEEEKESRVSTLTLARVSDYGLYEDNEAHSVFLCG